jgi:hypothetical protein
MLDYLLSAGFTRTYEEMKQEVSNMVRFLPHPLGVVLICVARMEAEYQPEDSGPSDQEVDQRNSIAEEGS